MSVSAQDIKDRERFLAAVCLSLANYGNHEIMWLFIAQMMASYVMSGEPSAMETADVIDAVISNVRELISQPEKIWDELMPGPVRNEPEWDAMLNRVDAVMNNHLDELAGELLLDRDDAKPKYENIVLDYEVAMHRHVEGDDLTLYAFSAEFFVDEHGIQWVKFTPTNGYSRGSEHIWRTDCAGFAVTRR
jgi:hypothetical protein